MAGFIPVGSIPVGASPAGSGIVAIRRRALLFANVGASIVTPVIYPPLPPEPLPARYDLNVINPGAEFRDLTGWTLIYGNTRAEPAPGAGAASAHSGNWYFYGGDQILGLIRQNVAIPADAWDAIDAHTVTANCSYWQARQVNDLGFVALQYIDASGVVIGCNVSGIHNNTGPFANFIVTGKVPKGTRSISINSASYEGNPTFNDNYTDDFELWLDFGTDIYPLELPIMNPDADIIASVAGTGWTITSGTVDGIAGPSGSGTYPLGSKGFFYAGVVAFSSMRQDVAVPVEAQADVDAGLVSIDWDWYIQAPADADSMQLRIEFYTAGLTLLGSSSPGLSSDGTGGWGWVAKNSTAVVPASTRIIRFISDMQRVTGSSNDGYSTHYRARLHL